MGASADAIPVIEFDDALPAIEGGDARQATTTAKFAKRDRPAIRPGRLASASILGKLRLEKVLLKRFKTMRRKTVKLTAAALKLPHEHLEKADADKTSRQILDSLATEWEYVAREAAGPLMDAALAGASIGGLQLDISSAGMLDSINTVARDWAADRAAEMVGMQRTEDGKLIPNPDAKWAISDTTRENLRDVVTGLFDAEGELSLRDVETAIEDAGIFSDTRATMIANTEISRAQTEGNREAWRQSGVVEKVDVVVSAMHDLEDECDEAAAGSPYDLEDAPDIPLHPNCCLPGTLVSAGGRIAAQMSRWYEGEVITLRIEGMDELTVTPNHPVLTDHGWVLAGQLEQGMNLVSCGTPGSTSSIIGPHDEDVPTRIEEIADSLLKSGGMFTSGVPTSAEDFHGDGIIDGKVDVVWAASFLRGDWNIAEGAGEITLQPRSVGLAGFHAPSFSAQLVESVVGTTPSNMGSSGSGLAFSRRAPLGFGAPGFMEVPDGESMSREEFADRDAVDSAGLGDVHATFPEQVSFVKLLGVGRSKFAGHIYNLTTEFGWYSANGIITHNCECSLILSEIGEGESAEEE